MLLRKKIEPHCTYCIYAAGLDEESMICRKCGIVPIEHSCRRFKYDPLKRIPAAPNTQDFRKYDDADFSL